MSDYTPDTDDIKRAYQEQCNHYYADCEIKPKEHANEFDRWLSEHDAEVAKAERERLLALLPKHMPKTEEEQWAHEEVCYWCANFAGLGIAWKILQGGDDANPEWLSSP